MKIAGFVRFGYAPFLAESRCDSKVHSGSPQRTQRAQRSEEKLSVLSVFAVVNMRPDSSQNL